VYELLGVYQVLAVPLMAPAVRSRILAACVVGGVAIVQFGMLVYYSHLADVFYFVGTPAVLAR
jgi:hypothetical protein